MIHKSLLLLLLGVGPVMAGRGPLPGLNTATPYLIYYGNWDSNTVRVALNNYRVVILHPQSNIRAADIATLQRGPDNIAGTADDVRVLAYLSVGEDDRPGAPFTGDGLGPRIDPRSADTDPLSVITNALGLPSPAGTGYASYYLDNKSSPDGMPDRNAVFGSYYVNAGAPGWWSVLKSMTKTADGQAGLDEILTTNVGNGFNCDGVFLDTIDTAAPNDWGTPYEWTAPGMQALLQRIHTNYPGKLLMANRGLFFFNPNLKTYAYTIRPFVDLVMFESYYSDSSTNIVSPYFPDNKFDFAPKLNAEAGRPDGFTICAVDYSHSTTQSWSTVSQDYLECMGLQGWPLYRTSPSLNDSFNTNAAAWSATNLDTQSPTWDSTAAQGPTPSRPRVGIQELISGDHSATVYWDVARDQTAPVRYNLYYAIGQQTLNFATATKRLHVSPDAPSNYSLGTGPGRYAYSCTITGLQNGATCHFAVRAQDSASPAHEDTNTVALSVVPGVPASGNYQAIKIDGTFSDWDGLPWAYQGATDTNPVNFVAVQFANDTNHLFGHVKLSAPYPLFADYNSHLFIDADFGAETGYPVPGALFGSEMMIETAAGYDQRSGNFNAGTVSGLGWVSAPAGSATEFEFQISLAAKYPDGTKVIGTNAFRLLLQDNRGPETAIETGIPYCLANPPPGPLAIAQSGNLIRITWSGPGHLEFSDSLTTGSWTALTNASSPYVFQPARDVRFFRLGQ